MDSIQAYLSTMPHFEYPLGSLSPTIQSLLSVEEDIGYSSVIDSSKHDRSGFVSSLSKGSRPSLTQNVSDSNIKRNRSPSVLDIDPTPASKAPRTSNNLSRNFDAEHVFSDGEKNIAEKTNRPLMRNLLWDSRDMSKAPVNEFSYGPSPESVSRVCKEHLRLIISDHRYKEFSFDRCIGDIPVLEIRPYSKSDFAKGKMRHIYIHMTGINNLKSSLESLGYTLPKMRLFIEYQNAGKQVGYLLDKDDLVKDVVNESYVFRFGSKALVSIEKNAKLALSSNTVEIMNELSNGDANYSIRVDLVWSSGIALESFISLPFIRSKRISKRSFR